MTRNTTNIIYYRNRYLNNNIRLFDLSNNRILFLKYNIICYLSRSREVHGEELANRSVVLEKKYFIGM